MRRVACLTVALLVLAASPVAAQVSGDIGISVGLNASTLHSSTDDGLGFRSSAVGGVYGRLDVAGPVDLRSDLLFSQKGVAVSGDQAELVYQANYLELPVLIRGQLPVLDQFDLRLMAGPAVALKIFEQQTFRRSTINVSADNAPFFERTDVGITVGAAANLGTDEAPLGLDVRYTLGLVDATRSVEEQSGNIPAFPESGRNGALTVLVSFRISGGS